MKNYTNYEFDYWNFQKFHYKVMYQAKWLNFAGKNYDKGFQKSLTLFCDFVNQQYDDWRNALAILHRHIEANFPLVLHKNGQSISLSHLMWGRVYITACYFMRDNEFWLNALLPLMERMETDMIVKQDMLFLKKKVAELCWPKSLLAEQCKRQTIKLPDNMNNNQNTTEITTIIAQFPCIRLTPYMQFSNGCKGSVLLLRYNAEDSLLVFINSPERSDGNEHCDDNSLLYAEAERLYAYQQACMLENNGRYSMTLDMYKRFGAVELTDVYISALIADFVCSNLHRLNPYRFNWTDERTNNLLSNAITGCKMHEIKDEIDDFYSAESSWRRQIILQALNSMNAAEAFEKGLQVDWEQVKNKYIEWLERKPLIIKLYFAQQALAYYQRQQQLDQWIWLLEDTLRQERNHQISFRYSNYGIQQIIGLYAFCRHLYTENPDRLNRQYAAVPLQERIQIFETYIDACTSEMLAELNITDDPERSSMPTLEEAAQKARLRMNQHHGKQPEGLSDEQQLLYTQYEQGFFSKLNMDSSTPIDTPPTQDGQSKTTIGQQFNHCVFNLGELPSSSVPQPSNAGSSLSRSSDFSSKPSPKGGPRIKSLFPDPSTTDQEKQRLLNYLHAHNLGSNDFDSSEQNTMNRIVVCFFREWSKRNMLTPKVGATHLVRFLKSDCGLSLSVEDKALANILSKMINSQTFDPDWGGDVGEYFPK